MPNLDAWYADASWPSRHRDHHRGAPGSTRLLVAARGAATPAQALACSARPSMGGVCIVDNPPLIAHVGSPDTVAVLAALFDGYRDGLAHELRELLARYRFADAARVVLGVASAGTRAFPCASWKAATRTTSSSCWRSRRGHPFSSPISARASTRAPANASSPASASSRRGPTSSLVPAETPVQMGLLLLAPPARDERCRRCRDSAHPGHDQILRGCAARPWPAPMPEAGDAVAIACPTLVHGGHVRRGDRRFRRGVRRDVAEQDHAAFVEALGQAAGTGSAATR